MSSQRDRDHQYRPLNVRDALHYLDQVKIQFQDQPDVYNRFLDVMKEFKGQIIDTPGVIDRVSTLFRGQPHLIQGFNTFLPPGYRIECLGGEGDSQMITVTTPSGTVSHVPGGFAAAMDRKEREARASSEKAKKERKEKLAENRATQTGRTDNAAPAHVALPSLSNPTVPSGPSTPSAAHFLANAGITTTGHSAISRASATPMVEFNHAISFVNKIKNRFNADQDTYKQFLEILQTYQRDTRDIHEVYEQVTKLFNNAPDLLDEFKQFLPENGSGGLANIGFGSLMQAGASAGAERPPTKRTSKDIKDPVGKRKRGGVAVDSRSGQKKKPAQKADSPSGDEVDGFNISAGLPQTLASPDEVAFFDKVKKFIDDKVTYHEFLKLINLYVQDMIDTKVLLDRAELFIGNAGDVWSNFKRMVGADEAGNVGPAPTSAQGGFGFGGMIGVDQLVVENTPMLERVKPDLGGSKVKSYGPSYRKLPQSEINLQCTGRDAMCWEVLNDEWVSYPTWAAEDAAPFMAHKKNAYEEALHKSEEERHEYDYHIEANLRTIALLEPLNNKIQTMDPEERAHFNLKAGLGGQSKSIHQRIIKKVYGKELGPDIIKALHDNPVIALPIVLERLKSKDEEWKKAQREWNRVWREQDAKNFYKALDHQGVQFKANDKKTIAGKSLIAEVEARRREQTNLRATMLDKSPWRSKHQFNFNVDDEEVLKDVVKLVISYLDRVNNALSASDKDRIENQLRDFLPLLLMLDKDDFDAEFGDAEVGSQEDQDESEDSDGDVSMAEDDETSSAVAAKKNKKVSQAADLRKKLLKQVGERDARGSTMTPGPDIATTEAPERSFLDGTPGTENGERAETPLPVPADPAEVAEAVEKDKAVADASEQTWVQIETPEPSRAVSQSNVRSTTPSRKANFFANNHFYILIRLIQILYSRLLHCKTIANEQATAEKRPINPVAVRLGLAEPHTQNFGIEDGENPAQYYYGHLLSMTERLFENEVDMATYEETLRLMFGTKAYIMFTVDRVVAAIVKQTQTVLGDLKSQELYALLQRDRLSETTTTRQQIAYRMQAESVTGSEENLYKVECGPGGDTLSLSIQLLGREDLTVDDAETAQEKWKQYIESFTLVHPTEGLPHRVDEPFLKRTLMEEPHETRERLYDITSGVEIKIAMGSYQMFFSPGTEDYFHRKRSALEIEELEEDEADREEEAKEAFEDWYRDAVVQFGLDKP